MRLFIQGCSFSTASTSNRSLETTAFTGALPDWLSSRILALVNRYTYIVPHRRRCEAALFAQSLFWLLIPVGAIADFFADRCVKTAGLKFWPMTALAARPGGHGVSPATQNSVLQLVINPLFPAYSAWFVSCHTHYRRTGRPTMLAILHFASLVAVTVFAVVAALAFDWFLLRMMFVLMRPATAGRIAAPSWLARGTAQLARAYSTQR